MSKDKSYSEKVKFIASAMKSGEHKSNLKLYESMRDNKDGYGIKKKDFYRAVNALKPALKDMDRLEKRIQNSNAVDGTKERVLNAAMTATIRATERGRKEYIKTLSKQDRAIFEKTGKVDTVKDIEDSMFKNHPDADEYAEFYI